MAITGVHTSYTARYSLPSVTLNATEVVRLMQEYSAELGFVSNLLSDYASLANLSYETLVEAQQTDTRAPLLRGLIADTDLGFRTLRRITIKHLLPDWRTSVLN